MKCLLPGCNREARKKFCSNKHKDKYHNRVNPRGRYAHLAKQSESADREIDPEDDMHPMDSYSLGQD